MPKSFPTCIVTLAAAITVGVLTFAQDSDKSEQKRTPKETVKQVMGKAMSPKGEQLNKKVLSGKATNEEKLQLLDLFISLTENEAPKGDQASWQALTNSAMVAAARVAVGREGAIDELKAATNCKKCHDAHKPPAE
jgi:hypothetical protein